jgi:GT2 family glycosyltransferase
MDAADALGEDAILSAQIYYHAAPETIWYAGGRVILETGNTYHEGFGAPADACPGQGIAETDYASGCAFFVSTRLLKRIGLFDERFFLLYEETDLCYRARAIGVKSYVVRDAKVWHKVSLSFGGAGSPSYVYFLSRNRLLWAEKHLPLRRLLRVYAHASRRVLADLRPPGPGPIASGGRGWRRVPHWLAAYAAAVRTKYASPLLRAHVRGVRDYALRRFGNQSAAHLPLG